MKKLSDYVVDALRSLADTDHVFMLSGGMAMHLVDSFGRADDVRVIPMHHEQAAGIAANAHGRMRNRPGVCVVTAGPGATNAVTPCTGAWMESNPLIFLSGQVSRKNGRGNLGIRQKGIQEVDIVSIVKSVTKYAVHIEDPLSIRYHLEKAVYLATHGRPGPVWLDIPVDVQGTLIDEEQLSPFEPAKAEEDLEGTDDPAQAARSILAEIATAKRPLLVLGQGVRLAGASEQAQPLVDALGIPFQTSWNGMDLVAADHPLWVGRANVFGPRGDNIVLQNADLIVSIGCRLGMQHTGYNIPAFARGAKLLMVDLDLAEMNKPGLSAGPRFHCDAGAVITSLLHEPRLETLGGMQHEAWLKHCRAVRTKYGRPVPSEDAAGDVCPFHFVERAAVHFPANAVIPYGSSGMPHTVFGGNYRVTQGQRVFCFKGLAGMGYGLPCCVGAALAAPGRMVFTLIGEGGLQINIQELQTIAHLKLPVKVIIFNNGGYHSIHMTQTTFFDRHFVASGPESGVTFPPLDKIAAAYGFDHYVVERNSDVDSGLAKLCADSRPAFLEVMISPTKALEPKIVSYKKPDGTMESRPLEDMGPLLPRADLQSDLFIPLLGDLN